MATTTPVKPPNYLDDDIQHPYDTTGQPPPDTLTPAPPPPGSGQAGADQSRPATAPPPTAAPTTPPPAPGWIPLPGGGWAPPGHPDTMQTGTGQNTAVPGNPQTIQDVYRQQMMSLLQGPTPEQAAANAATSPQVAAFNTAQQRSTDRARAQLAETSAQSGVSGSGGQTTANLGLEQQRGEAEAQYAADASQKAFENRQQQLMQGIQMAQQAGQFDAAQALQKELAQMQVNAQLQESSADLALREKLGLGQLDISKLTLAQQKELAGLENQYQYAALSQEGELTRGAQAIQQQLGLGDLGLREKLGLGDLDLRRYGIDVSAGTAADMLGFNYGDLGERMREFNLNYLKPPPQEP